MGRGTISTSRAKFHTTADVVTAFASRVPPEVLQRTAWWHFLGVTVSGGEADLLRVYGEILVMLQDLPFDGFPIEETAPEAVGAELLDDLALLLPTSEQKYLKTKMWSEHNCNN